jgi:hypothetical protein
MGYRDDKDAVVEKHILWSELSWQDKELCTVVCGSNTAVCYLSVNKSVVQLADLLVISY